MDMEKVIKEFEEICGYTMRPHEFRVLNDVLALLKEQEHKDKMYHALEEDWKRLKEQPQIVRCKDCKHYDKDMIYCNKFGIQNIDNDWFCADGERQEGRRSE